MRRVLGVARGILTVIGGFVDIGDIVTNAFVGSRFRRWSSRLPSEPSVTG